MAGILRDFPQDSLAYTGRLQLLIIVTALFTDMTGNIPFLRGKTDLHLGTGSVLCVY